MENLIPNYIETLSKELKFGYDSREKIIDRFSAQLVFSIGNEEEVATHLREALTDVGLINNDKLGYGIHTVKCIGEGTNSWIGCFCVSEHTTPTHPYGLKPQRVIKIAPNTSVTISTFEFVIDNAPTFSTSGVKQAVVLSFLGMSYNCFATCIISSVPDIEAIQHKFLPKCDCGAPLHPDDGTQCEECREHESDEYNVDSDD